MIGGRRGGSIVLPAALLALLWAPFAVAATVPVVVDPAGEPVPGAHVQILDLPTSDSPVAALTHRLVDGSTSEDGRFPAPVPELGGLLVLVDHPDFGPLVQQRGVVASRIVLNGGQELSGRVRAAPPPESAAPAAPADSANLALGRVCARWSTKFAAWHWNRDWERCASLSPQGGFHLAGLPAGQVVVEAQVPGYLPARAEVKAGEHRSDGKAKPAVVLDLHRGTLITGRVTDPANRKIGRATVQVEENSTEIDGEGRFRLAVSSLPVRLEIEAPGYRSSHLDLLPKHPVADLHIELQPGQQVAGILMGPDGPLDAGELWAERRDGPKRHTSTRLSFDTEDGAFRVDLPEPGSYQLALSAPGYRVSRLPETELAGGDVWTLGVVALSQGGVVQGRLIDPTSGEGVPGASLRLLPLGNAVLETLRRNSFAGATSGDDGSFRITGLEAGEYELRISHSDDAPMARELIVGRDETVDLGDVGLGTGVAVSGQVTDRSGEGRAGVRIELETPSGQGLEALATALTSPDGKFDGISVQPGCYRVRVVGNRPLLSQEIEIPSGEDHYEAHLVVSSVRVVGSVLRAGEPVAGGEVSLSSDLDPGWRRGAVMVSTGGELEAGRLNRGLPSTLLRARVDDQGSFVVDDAPPGPVTARYVGPRGEQHLERLRLPDRAESRVTLHLDGKKITGRATDAESGAGIAARVRLFDLAGRTVASATAAADGSFRFDDLEVQHYRLEVVAEGHRTATIDPVVPNGQTLRVALEPGHGGSLAVRLSRADGSPAGRVQVSVLSAAGNLVRSLLTDPLGRRDFDDLPAGSYFVVWSDPVTGTGSTAPVEVSNDEVAHVDERLDTGSSLVLACNPDSCAGTALAGIALFTAEGVEVSAYLPRLDPVLRFSAAGNLGLGRLAPGRYLLRVWTDRGRSDHLITAGGGTPVVATL